MVVMVVCKARIEAISSEFTPTGPKYSSCRNAAARVPVRVVPNIPPTLASMIQTYSNFVIYFPSSCESAPCGIAVAEAVFFLIFIHSVYIFIRY